MKKSVYYIVLKKLIELSDADPRKCIAESILRSNCPQATAGVMLDLTEANYINRFASNEFHTDYECSITLIGREYVSAQNNDHINKLLSILGIALSFLAALFGLLALI